MEDENGRSCEELLALAQALLEQDRGDDALAAKQDHLRLLVASLGRFHPAIFEHQLELAEMQLSLGHTVPALEGLHELKQRIPESLTDRHPFNAQCWLAIGRTYRALDQVYEASLLLEDCVRFWRTHHQDRLIESAEAHQELAECYGLLNKEEKCCLLLEESLSLLEQEGEALAPRFLQLGLSLAERYKKSERITDAIRILERLVNSGFGTQSGCSERIVEANLCLSELYIELEDWEQYEQCLVRALETMVAEKTSQELGRELFEGVARAYKDGCNAQITLEQVNQAYQLAEQSFKGSDPTLMLSAQMTLGECLFLGGSFSGAKAVFQALLDTRPAIPNATQAVCFQNLGTTCAAENDFASAEHHFRNALSIQENEQRGTQEHGATLFALGTIQKILGKRAEAISLLKECSDIRQSLFGEEHPLTLQVKESLAVLSQPPSHQEATARQPRPSSAAYSFSDIASDFNLALLRINENNLREAAELLEKVRRLVERQQGKEHQDLLPILEQLKTVYGSMGRAEQAEAYSTQIETIQTRHS